MPKKPKTIVQGHARNFNTLAKAFAAGDVALLECKLRATGEMVATICATRKEGEEIVFTPFAIFLNGNPYELLDPPDARTMLSRATS